MRLIALSLVSALALAACGEQEAAPPPSEPSASAPAPANPPTSGEVPTAEPPADACGAAERQDWVGRARSSLPSAPAGAIWRIYETGQPVTQDLSLSRLNIEIDPDSQSVVRLSCG